MNYIDDKEVFSIIPAAPGYFAHYEARNTAPYRVPVACWALVRYRDHRGMLRDVIAPVTTEGVGLEMRIATIADRHAATFMGVSNPGEPYVGAISDAAIDSFQAFEEE